MVRRDVASRKIAQAEARLAEVQERFGRPKEEFLEDVEGRDLATFYLFLAIQDCIDLAAHWVADSGWGPPDDIGGSFDLLAEREVIDRDLAEAMRQAVGLRHRIAHDYAAVDHERLYREFTAGVQALTRFLAEAGQAAGL